MAESNHTYALVQGRCPTVPISARGHKVAGFRDGGGAPVAESRDMPRHPLPPRPTGRLALPVLVLGLMAPGRSAAQGPPPAPALIPFAQSYTAAWNAHGLGAVLTFFAPDAVVRERWGDVPPAVWDTRDPRVVRDYLDNSDHGEAYNTHGFAWVTGRQQIAAWAAARFAPHHRVALGQHRVAGDAVSWPYQEFRDPYQHMPGVGPLEGTVEAVVRGGRITVLTLVVSPASLWRQQSEVASVLNHLSPTTTTRPPVPLSGGTRAPSRGAKWDGPPTAEPTTAAWPLALGSLAVLAYATAWLRRRQAPRT